jgi:hypothetical protein
MEVMEYCYNYNVVKLIYKVAQRSYRGKGGLGVKKGDMILTDCNVTGTDTGSPDKPKFSLRLLWEHCLFPSLDALVGIGGQYEGAIVVHQEDNAGHNNSLPHSSGSKNVASSLTLTLPMYMLCKGPIKREDFRNG